MEKIDKRKNYYLMLDTETANTQMLENGQLDMSSVLVYDIGFQVIDRKGNIYQSGSYIIKDIFLGEKELMSSAYYCKKIPKYLQDLQEGKREMKTFYEVRQIICEIMAKFNINTAIAHNARFDYNALNTTQRFLTKSKYRYFFPKNTKMWDTLKMANDTICKQKMYKAFCQENGFLTKNNQVRKTAEILYRYISKNNNFIESHTGLEDVKIETKIFVKCLQQHKKMRKELFDYSKPFSPIPSNVKYWYASIL